MVHWITGGEINDYFYWWYNDGLDGAWRGVKNRFANLVELFSVPILLRTLFAPWKNDVQSAINLALDDQIKLWEQNLASRVFGFLIRLLVLTISAAILLLVGFSLAIYLFIWLMLPFIVALLIATSFWLASL